MALLSPGGFLAPLLGLNKRTVVGLKLDVHLRPKDEVHVYCGLTRVLDAQRLRSGQIKASAHKDYRDKPSAKAIFRTWNTSESDKFERALGNYLRDVVVGGQHTDHEGTVQWRWSRVNEPWTPFDREARLRYRSREERRRLTDFDHVKAARTELMGRWARLPTRGLKVDQLAVDGDGRLVLIELKDASATSDKVYYAPLQLLQYVWQWHCALEHVRDDVQELIDARVKLGLTPTSIPPLTGGIRPIVGFGADCRSDEVKRRYEEVLRVVNAHLPPGVSPIETWAFEDGAAQPQRVDC